MNDTSQKRSKNFTEQDKIILLEVAKEFVHIIDNKKTDGVSVEAKKESWKVLTAKYNAVTESGPRTEKQLHALYDNLKKLARKNMNDDKVEMYKTGGGTFCPKTTVVDEKVVALLTPQFKPLVNIYDSSSPYYKTDKTLTLDVTLHEPTKQVISQEQIPCSSHEEIIPSSSQEQFTFSVQENVVINAVDEIEVVHDSPLMSPPKSNMSIITTPQQKKLSLTGQKKKINSITSAICKRKYQKQINDDLLTEKKIELVQLQIEQEKIKFEKLKKF